MPELEILTSANLRRLYKLLGVYSAEVKKDNPLAAEVINLVRRWVETEQRYDE